jgi:(4-alkanoyl-5-oxo-2,5-dihydrofuran-3-yl)methyl phosphate reductase
MILVLGATGNVGSGVVDLLRKDGIPVRALTRDPAKVALASGVEVVRGDFREPATIADALSGIDAVFMMAPVPLIAAHARMVAEMARRSGTRRIVLLSSLSAEQEPDNTPTVQHRAAEEAVRQSGCEWTIVRGGQFMSNSLRWAASILSAHEVRPYVRNDPSAIIDPLDIAAVVATALTQRGHSGKIYGVTGGESLTPEECTSILSRQLGIELTYVELSDEEAQSAYVALFGDTAEVREKLRTLRAVGVLPWQKARSTVRDVLGRPPRTFSQWAAANAAAFRGSA